MIRNRIIHTCRHALQIGALLLFALIFSGASLAQSQGGYMSISAGEGTLSYYVSASAYGASWNEFSFTPYGGSRTYIDAYLNCSGSGGSCNQWSGWNGTSNVSSNTLTLQVGNCTIYFGGEPFNYPYGGAGSECTAPATSATGYIQPKYVVLSVRYAPPGSASYVNYGTSVTNGASSSISQSFNASGALSISVTGGVSIPGILNASETGSIAATNTQEQDSSSSIAILKSTSVTYTLSGPPHDGLDHSYDQVVVWLNPAINLTVSPSGSVQQSGYAYDLSDPCYCMDTIALPVRQLVNPSLITDQNTLAILARTWAPNLADGSSPGLTPADLLSIAAADPYSSASYNPTPKPDPDYDGSVCTTDGRFCLSNNQNIGYSPYASTNYTQSSSQTDTVGMGATDTRQVAFGYDYSVGGSFIANLTVALKMSTTLTWTNKWTSLTNSMTGQTSTAYIVGPTDGIYSGPTEFCIYTDNVYGTYMFLPCN